MRIQVKDFMSTPVITATGEDSVLEIRELMEEKGIQAIPIVSYTNDKLKVEVTIRGIITATDINKDMPEDTNVEDVMNSSSIHIIHLDSSAQSAAKMMLRHKVHHLIIMEDGEILGMISSLDFVRLVAEHSFK
jgi:CBS domain-containing protein